MKFLAATTLFFAAVLAAPTEVYAPPPPTYSLPANGGGSPPHGTVPPPPGNKPSDGNGNGNGNSPHQPGNTNNDASPLCPSGLLSVPNCCATDVLGVVDLNCASPATVPQDAADFGRICAKSGQQPKCCLLPVAGQAVLCQEPLGVWN